MRFLYVDIDTLRPDHLGCYGYHRDTSPSIDTLAAGNLRFEKVYASDTPCLPSRTALTTGRFGIHNGVVSHGGTAGDLFVEGSGRGFRSRTANTSWVQRMRNSGMRATTFSTFGERHSAFHWYAGYNEVCNVGKGGLETADEVVPLALDWMARNATRDNWFLHVHIWDPHTPYRTPRSYGDPFADAPLPPWLTEEVRAQHWSRPGPHSPQEATGYDPRELPAMLKVLSAAWNVPPGWLEDLKRQPGVIASMEDVRKMFDGYDTGVRYADDHVGRLLNQLADLGVYDDTAVMISSDHGETLGELSIYGDHHTADEFTSHLPLILKWPGATTAGTVDAGFHYQVDIAATVLELLDLRVPTNWDGVAFADALRAGGETGRDHLVLSHGAHTAQRSARFDDWLYMRTYHDGFHAFDDVMLFDLASDPFEQHNVAAAHPDMCARGQAMLEGWHAEMMATATHPVDPFDTIAAEGGPSHTVGHAEPYMARLRATGRGDWADDLERKHGLAPALA